MRHQGANRGAKRAYRRFEHLFAAKKVKFKAQIIR